MTDRKKLVELLDEAHDAYYAKCDFGKGYMETLADYLLDNGVTFAADTNDGCKWISVEDRMPETDGKNTFEYSVLVYIPKREGYNQHGVYIGKLKRIEADDGSGNFLGLKRPACDWTVCGFSYFEQPVVTHWMPMPTPPLDTANQAADL